MCCVALHVATRQLTGTRTCLGVALCRSNAHTLYLMRRNFHVKLTYCKGNTSGGLQQQSMVMALCKPVNARILYTYTYETRVWLPGTIRHQSMITKYLVHKECKSASLHLHHAFLNFVSQVIQDSDNF